MPLNYQPGTAWEYSDATDVVGRLVEVISGQPLDVFLRERIFKPLQMPDTHFWLDESHAARLTTQYKPGDDLTIVRDDPGGGPVAGLPAPRRSFAALEGSPQPPATSAFPFDDAE